MMYCFVLTLDFDYVTHLNDYGKREIRGLFLKNEQFFSIQDNYLLIETWTRVMN